MYYLFIMRQVICWFVYIGNWFVYNGKKSPVYGAKKAPSRTSRHHALNDLVARAFASAAIPMAKEPQGLSRADGKRPDGLTMVPWREGKPLTWDITVVCPLAESYIGDSATNAGSVAEAAATRKAAKYAV